MREPGLYIYCYVFWLFVYVLPAAAVAFLLFYFAIKFRIATRLLALFIVCLLIAFPPMEKRGDWQKEATGQRAAEAARFQLDRFWYGYSPHYRWIGVLFAPDIPDHGRSSVIGESGVYRLLSFHYKVSLMYFIPQCVLVLLGLWKLNRASNRNHCSESGGRMQFHAIGFFMVSEFWSGAFRLHRSVPRRPANAP